MIAEVETDKATMEVECFEDGILIKQYCKEGEEVPVGGAIAAVGEAGEAAPEPQSPSSTEQADSKPAPAPVPTAAETEATAPSPAPKVESAAPAPAPSSVNPPKNDLADTRSNSDRLKASPLAKKIAAEKGIDLSSVTGSGPGGRIVRADVENSSATSSSTSTSPSVTQKTENAARVETLEALDLPVSNMRKSIASALVASKTQAPHFYLQIEVDGAPLSQLRKELNEQLAELPPEAGGAKFSVNDLTLKAAAEAVKRVPAINRSWLGDSIKQHPNVDLAFGVAIDDGLVTPVIRSAETKSLRQVSAEAKILIKKARGKKLAPNEMSGSTYGDQLRNVWHL